MKKYFGFDGAPAPAGGFSRGFLGLFALLLLPALGLWFFYRWNFGGNTTVLVPIFLAVTTAWIWAYLIGYGSADHLDEG